MDLTQLANLGEFIGGVAVLVTLIYLAIQVRHNTRTLVATTVGDVTRASADLSIAIAASDGASEAMRMAYTDPDHLTPNQRFRFDLLIRGSFRNFENYFYQSEQGFLDRDVWVGIERNIEDLFREAVMQEWWRRHRTAFGERFQAHVDQMVAREASEPSVWSASS